MPMDDQLLQELYFLPTPSRTSRIMNTKIRDLIKHGKIAAQECDT
jgi:hypothetical protein